MFPSPHVNVRLDVRTFATFVDADVTFVACAPGTCILAFHTDVVSQAEFTAGLVVRFR